jgi:glucan biosynthesis protein C
MQHGAKPARLFYLDNLRALAMLAGLFFHAALAYSPMLHSFWPSADPKNHLVFDIFAWASHLFRMPVFFLLAGFFCALMLQQSGGMAFFKNRMLRIALPLLLFLPVLWVLMKWVIQFGLEHVTQQPPFLIFIQTLLALPEPPKLPLSTMHLWFLYHLLFLYLLTWCCRVLLDRKMISGLRAIKPNLLLLLMIVSCVPALYAVSVPFPAPEWIFPALWALWFYGLFFALGYGFYLYPDWLEQFAPDRHFYLVIGGISYAFYYYLLPANLIPPALNADTQPQGLLKLTITMFEAMSAVLWTLAAVLYARQFLDRSSPLLRYISNVSYWVYIVHLPLLFFIQFALTDLTWPIGVKFLVSSLGTLAISLLSFHLLVSWSWLAKMLTSNKSV